MPNSTRHPWFSLRRPVLSLICLPVSSVFAQDVVGEMPSLPSGFSDSEALLYAADSAKPGALSFSLGLRAQYDSNVNLGSGNGLEEVDSDLVITPSLGASYLLRNSRFQLGLNSNVSYKYYQNRDDYNAANYSLGIFGGYRSKKLVASFTAGVSTGSGVNRLVGGFAEQLSLSSGLLASYRFSPKTSLVASWNQSQTYSQSGGFGDTSSVNYGLSGLWQATPLLSVGPGIRYAVRTAADDEELTSIGPTLRLNYDLSTKVKLRSTVGYSRSDLPSAGSKSSSNWSVGLSYNASALWGLDFTMVKDTQAALSAGSGFDESTSYRINYRRKIRRAQLSLGMSYNDRSPFDDFSDFGVARDSEYLSVTAGLSMPVFKNQAALSLDFSISDQSNSTSDSSWDSWQAGVGLTWQF